MSAFDGGAFDASAFDGSAAAVISGTAVLDDVAASGGIIGAAGPSLTVSGTATLDDVSASGGITSTSGPSLQVSGTATLDDISASGLINAGGQTLPPPTGVGFLASRRVTVRYSVIDRQEVPDLSVKAPGETITLVFDFAPFVGVTAAQVELARVGGDDGLPPLARDGDAVIVGAQALQRVTAGSAGNTYDVRCWATTPDNSRVVAKGRLPVRNA